jgi:hypothetical protein
VTDTKVTIPWCIENTGNFPTVTPLALWIREHQGRETSQIKAQSTRKEALENGNQKTNKQPDKNPSSVCTKSPGAWHRNPCLTQQPENPKTDLQSWRKASEDAILFYKMHSALLHFSKIVPDEGEKGKLGQEFHIHKIFPMSVSGGVSRLIWAAKVVEQLIGLLFFRQVLWHQKKLEKKNAVSCTACGGKVEEIEGKVRKCRSMNDRKMASQIPETLVFRIQDHVDLSITYGPSSRIYSLKLYVVLGRPGCSTADVQFRIQDRIHGDQNHNQQRGGHVLLPAEVSQDCPSWQVNSIQKTNKVASEKERKRETKTPNNKWTNKQKMEYLHVPTQPLTILSHPVQSPLPWPYLKFQSQFAPMASQSWPQLQGITFSVSLEHWCHSSVARILQWFLYTTYHSALLVSLFVLDPNIKK